MAALSVSNLSIYAWGNSLIDKLSLTLQGGELLAIIGPNGAGKSTLVNTIVNDALPKQQTSGDLVVCGQPYNAWKIQDRAKQVALLSQTNNLSFPFTVEEVIRLGRIPHSTTRDIDKDIVNKSLGALDITHLKSRFYTQLSGGEKQRVQLARVMTQIWREEDCIDVNENVNSNAKDKPQRLLLLDEPTSSLDLGHQHQLMNVIRDFANQGVAIVMIAHDINLVVNHADSIVALNAGKVLAQGHPSTVVNAELMQKLYGVDVTILPHPQTGKPIVISS